MANNTEEVYLGKPVTGAVQTAPVGTTGPTDAGTELPSASWDASGFVDENGVTLSQTRNTNDLKAWGGSTVRTMLNEFDGTVQYSEMQTDEVVMKRMVGADKVTITAATSGHGKQMKVSLGSDLPDPIAWVFSMKDGDKRVRIYIPKGQLTEVGDTNFVHNGAIKWDFTIKALDDGTGNSIYIFTDDGKVLSDSDTDTDTE